MEALVDSLEPRVKSLEDWVKGIDGSINKLAEKVDRVTATLVDRVNAASQPNFGTLALWAAILLTIIGMIAAPIGYFVMRDSDHHADGIHELDSKLQREFNLMIETQREGLAGLSKVYYDRHTEAIDMIRRLESWRDDQTRSDLEELRQRRTKDKP